MNVTSKPRNRTIRRGADQMAFRRARLPLTALCAAAVMVLPGVARAAVVRTVCSLGCDFGSITEAVTQSNPDDFIEVMPGTYREQVIVTERLHIFAPSDGPRPVVTSSQPGFTMRIQGDAAGTTISHLDIRGTGPDSSALEAFGAVSAFDLALAGAKECAALVAPTPSQLGPGVTASSSSTDSDYPCVDAGFTADDSVTGVAVDAPNTVGVELWNHATLMDSTVNAEEALDLTGGTVRRTTLNGADVGLRAASAKAILVADSVVTSSGDGGIAVLASGGVGGPVELRNVTAVAGGSSSTGLEALRQIGSIGIGAAIDARSVIARGTANGAFGEPGFASGCGGPCAAGEVTLGYSSVNDPGGVIDTTTVGHNQSADPLLVNPVVGPRQDFHIASAASPAIGAGAPDPSDGPTDRDGLPHPNPPSIGAYEFVGLADAPAGGTAQPGTGGGNAGTAVGNAGTAGGIAGGKGAAPTKPRISALTETNRVFAVGPKATALIGDTVSGRTKRGTVFSFELDQPATVMIAIRTDARARNCHAGNPESRGTRRCTRPTTVAALTRSGHLGLNRVPFGGRIGRRPLKPGRYEAAFTATDSAGSSTTQVLRFVVVKR